MIENRHDVRARLFVEERGFVGEVTLGDACRGGQAVDAIVECNRAAGQGANSLLLENYQDG
jgi:hypothetical protein